MTAARKLVVIGFDSISLPTLEDFVRRGCMPTVGRLMAEGCTTQTWPCFPMETGTNWACLATGASPWVTGCNMSLHLPGEPLDQWHRGFPAEFCKAEQLWTAAARAGKRSVVFDWSQSWPLSSEEGIIHVGEDGRPDNALRALQEVRAYATHPRAEGQHVTRIAPAPGPEGTLEFPVPIAPGGASRYERVEPLHARILPAAGGGYDRVALYAAPDTADPLLTVRLGEWSQWQVHEFVADGKPTRAGLRAKLLILEPDGSKVHLYLSEIYCQEDFVHPTSLAGPLVEAAGPLAMQASRQQVVQGGASDIATYMDEQRHLARWWRDAASRVLGGEDWDLFMLKWHGPDWTNHLTMYMIDPRHPMYEPKRADEGWALWEELMGWGDEIVATVLDAAGPDALVALVSDHGGGTDLPGYRKPRDANALLEEKGWLVRKGEGFDFSRSVAYSRGHYVFLNVKGRDPRGIVEPGREFRRLREEVVNALLGWRGGGDRPAYRVVLPMEDAGRLGVGGDRVGDIFLVPAKLPPDVEIDAAEFRRTHPVEETGTWDWPRLNAGSHLDDSYFVLSGPGVKRGLRRQRPTRITSVAPTLAAAWGIPTPADADGAVLGEFLE